MTPEEQRIAIAKACGIPTTRLTVFGETAPSTLMALPDYVNDLNAMHQAEKILDTRQWRVYSNKLMVALRETDLTLNASNIEARYKTVHATAPQRAEALLRTIGKWKEPGA